VSLRRDESFDQIDGFEVLETRIGEVTVQVGTGLVILILRTSIWEL
jgi:hypothetical protein